MIAKTNYNNNPIVRFLYIATAACAFPAHAAAARATTSPWATGFVSSGTAATTTTALISASSRRFRRSRPALPPSLLSSWSAKDFSTLSLDSIVDGFHDEFRGKTSNSGPDMTVSRREAILAVGGAAALLLALPDAALADIEGIVSIPMSTESPESNSVDVSGNSVTLFKTKSGLQYIDFAEGSGPTPRYGNFVTVSYKAYVKLPDVKGQPSKLDEFDSESGFLIKHGNGRNVPGFDEGLHTMRPGGRRRIIVPPKLGYVTSGLGPIPSGPIGRWKLNRLLDRMVEVQGGNLIFDVEIRNIMADEADQGYYDDKSLTPAEFSELGKNLQESQKSGKSS